ncbi:hypothetical protein RIE95_09210 [Acidithiobacillus thiooxidans]|uniref:hypothetical protein n=1 Tax=Acidithiobacillus thiooxidans TaxID=930 RepID=UPI002857AB4A|nr:hypothetical protein [Acidithiobacillus thiooxidans]MDR7927155.1 hypothetical protein [Acidithiobacillus thiooxidans]
MTAYLIGNLLGRLLMSWLIVFLVVLLRQRGRLRVALRRSLWSWGWIPVGILFVLGILGTVLAHH